MAHNQKTGSPEMPAEARVVALAQEEALVSARQRRTTVRVSKRPQQRTETVEIPLKRSAFEVKRVPVERILTEKVLTRVQDGVTIIPVMEERLVIEKKLVLVEEIHLVPRETVIVHREEVQLRSEEVTVTRVPADSSAC